MPRLLILAAALAACAHHAETGKRVRYACDEGAELVVYYAHDGTLAVVSLDGREIPMPLAPSGSGARYAGEGYDLYTKGDTAMLDRDEKRVRVGCRVTRPEPLIEKPQIPRFDLDKLLPNRDGE